MIVRISLFRDDGILLHEVQAAPRAPVSYNYGVPFREPNGEAVYGWTFAANCANEGTSEYLWPPAWTEEETTP